MDEPAIEDPVLGQRLRFRPTMDPDGGEGLHVETGSSRGGVTPHLHPAMAERFEVLAGQPSLLAGQERRTAAPGDSVVVPAGLRHAHRRQGDEIAHMVCHVRPPSALREFLEGAAALGRAGKLTRRALPKSLGALLEAAVLAHNHHETLVLLFPPMPPPP